MSADSGLDRLQKGVLVFIANRPVHRNEAALTVAESQGMSEPELVAALGRSRVSPESIDHRAHTLSAPLRLRNPYYTKDAGAIHAAVESLREAGLIESRPPSYGSRRLVHFITRDGAKAIGNTFLVDAIDQGITAGDYKKLMANAESSHSKVTASPDTVAMSDVEVVLGNVLGRDSRIAQQIMELLRNQNPQGR